MRLTLETFDRIRRAIEGAGGSIRLREFPRRYSISTEIVREAEEGGWIVIESQKPPVGRPAIVVSLSKSQPTKLPPSRRMIGRRIKFRHWNFAMLTVFKTMKGGGGLAGLPGYVEAYMEAYPTARSRAGAYASCSRLLRHPHVFAAREWFYAKLCGEIPGALIRPDYESEIWTHLEIFRSWRARHRPTSTHSFTERRW